MPEAVVNAPVVTTATTEADRGAPAPAPKQPARNLSSTDKRIEDVLSGVWQKHGGNADEFKSLGQITDQVTKKAPDHGDEMPAEAKKAAPPQPKVEEPPPKTKVADDQPKTKEKFKVGDQEYELDSEQQRRFIQKGIYYEKKGVEIAKFDKDLQAREAQVAQQEAREQQFLAALEKDPGAVLEYLFGDQAFDKIKPWATGKVQKIQQYEQNPELARIEAAERERDQAKAQLQQYHQEKEQAQIQEGTQKYLSEYQKTIVGALELVGLPAGENVDFMAAEMASHMQRALAKGVEYTPQQLAEVVKQDTGVRVKSITGALANKILEAKKSNDDASVIKYGEQAVQMLGEPIMHAIAKYHLARIRGSQPTVPKQILETPRVKTDNSGEIRRGKDGRQYMTEDEYKEMRGKIIRGEIEQPPWW